MKNILTFTFSILLTHLFAQPFDASRLQIDNSIFYYAVADFNGDSYDDIFYSESSGLYLLTNDKSMDATFTSSKIMDATSVTGNPMPLDIDDDGDIDIIYPSGSQFDLIALINDGNGAFSQESLNISGAHSLLKADMDLDGDLDLIGFNNRTKKVFLYTKTANMTYTSKEIFSSNNFSHCSIGDMDNDGKTDIVVCVSGFSGKQLLIFQNVGDNTFNERVIFENRFRVNLSSVADFNGDGLLDIAFSSNNRETNLAINNGSFSFESIFMHFNNDGFNEGILATDVTGDNTPEILVSNTRLGNRLIRITDKNDFTTEIENFSGGFGMYTMTPTDLNKDNATDLVGSNGSLWFMINKIPQVPSSTKNWAPNYSIYPIPTSNILTIKGLADGNYTSAFYSMSGNLVSTLPIGNNVIELSSLPAGFYVMEIRNHQGDVELVSKVIKN